MKLSESGIDHLKTFEGLEEQAYKDIAGVWTIGYGHTRTAAEGMVIDARTADTLLRADIAEFEGAVRNAVRVKLNQNEFDALVSFSFNVGANALRRSTALKRLNRGDREGAAEALTWWNKATVNGVRRPVEGLTRRRAAEAALFLTPIDAEPKALAGGAVIVEEKPSLSTTPERYNKAIAGGAVASLAGAVGPLMQGSTLNVTLFLLAALIGFLVYVTVYKARNK